MDYKRAKLEKGDCLVYTYKLLGKEAVASWSKFGCNLRKLRCLTKFNLSSLYTCLNKITNNYQNILLQSKLQRNTKQFVLYFSRNKLLWLESRATTKANDAVKS